MRDGEGCNRDRHWRQRVASLRRAVIGDHDGLRGVCHRDRLGCLFQERYGRLQSPRLKQRAVIADARIVTPVRFISPLGRRYRDYSANARSARD